MSDTPAENAPEASAEAPAQESDGQNLEAEVARLREELTKARKWEQRAKENKAAADRLAELEEANKTEVQKLAERAEKAEAELAALQTNALRAEVALEKGLTPAQAKRLIGSTREELEADADQLLADLGAQNAPRAPKPDPNQGRQSGGTASTADQFAAAIGAQFTT